MKRIRILVYLLAMIALGSSARAAIGEQVWVQRYNGPGNGSDNAFAIAVDTSGNVFVTGQSPGTSTYDFATIKYSNAGVPLWTNRYEGPGNGDDVGHAIVVDSYGDVIVTGQSAGTNTTDDYATIKYSNAGTPLWTNRFDHAGGHDYATAVAVDTNDNVFVTGYFIGGGWATIKYSGLGIPQWTNRYVGPVSGSHYVSGIAVGANGNVFVTGSSAGSGSGDDFATVAYSNSGVPLWTNRYNGPGNGDDTANDIALDSNGNIFVTGGVTAGGLIEFATLKYSNAGLPLWTNRYRGQGTSTYGGAGEMVVDSNGNVFVTGASVGSGTYNDFATIKYSNAGVALWTNRYNRLYDDVPIALVLDAVGNLFVTGYTMADNLRFDRLTIGYSNAGIPLWTNSYNGPGNNDDSGNAIAVDGNGNVFVTGYSYGTGNHDYATIKYAGVQPIPLTAQQVNNSLVLSWSNATFRLQSAPTTTGTFTNIPSATSPYTNAITAPPQYFRLKLN